MSAQLTVVPLRQEKQRGPVGVVGRTGSLTRVDASDGDLEAAAIRCVARHFDLQDADVRNVLTNEPRSAGQAVLAHAGVHSTRGQGVQIVCVLVMRRNIVDWFIAAGHGRHELEWLPRSHCWSSPDDGRAVGLAVEALRELLRRTTIATVLVEHIFSVPDLRQIYDDLWDTSMDAPNFQRRFTAPRSALLQPVHQVEVASIAELDALPGEVVARTRRSELRQSLAYPPPDDDQRAAAAQRGRPPQLWVAGEEMRLEPPLMVPPSAGWKPVVLGPWQFEDIQGGSA